MAGTRSTSQSRRAVVAPATADEVSGRTGEWWADVPGIGKVAVKATSPNEVNGENLLLDAQELNGDLTAKDATVGQDASRFSIGAPGARGPVGTPGPQAGSVTLDNQVGVKVFSLMAGQPPAEQGQREGDVRHHRALLTMWSAFRDFRRTRPFWGGLFNILGGLEIILLPLSPIADLILLGVAGISGALIGIVLVVIGGFVWFSPPNRSLAGVLTLVFSLASFVVSNWAA
jgi:hypothetical protein